MTEVSMAAHWSREKQLPDIRIQGPDGQSFVVTLDQAATMAMTIVMTLAQATAGHLRRDADPLAKSE